MFVAGRVGRPHGLDGSFHVMDPAPDVISAGRSVRVGDAETEIVAIKGTAAKPIARLALASDRTAIEALRGAELFVDAALAPPLDADEYRAEDLVGSAVVDGSRSLGTVSALLALPSCEVLELDTGLLVPMVRDAIRSVDVEARRIDVDGGFLGAA
jgi:16S rRNA processing protein RimM